MTGTFLQTSCAMFFVLMANAVSWSLTDATDDGAPLSEALAETFIPVGHGVDCLPDGTAVDAEKCRQEAGDDRCFSFTFAEDKSCRLKNFHCLPCSLVQSPGCETLHFAKNGNAIRWSKSDDEAKLRQEATAIPEYASFWAACKEPNDNVQADIRSRVILYGGGDRSRLYDVCSVFNRSCEIEAFADSSTAELEAEKAKHARFTYQRVPMAGAYSLAAVNDRKRYRAGVIENRRSHSWIHDEEAELCVHPQDRSCDPMHLLGRPIDLEPLRKPKPVISTATTSTTTCGSYNNDAIFFIDAKSRWSGGAACCVLHRLNSDKFFLALIG